MTERMAAKVKGAEARPAGTGGAAKRLVAAHAAIGMLTALQRSAGNRAVEGLVANGLRLRPGQDGFADTEKVENPAERIGAVVQLTPGPG